MRTFVDASGTAWEVFEVRRASQRPESVRPGLEDGWLTFQSVAGKRRVGHYPTTWENLTDGELGVLCLQGLPVTLGGANWLADRMTHHTNPAPKPHPGLAELSLQLKRSSANNLRVRGR